MDQTFSWIDWVKLYRKENPITTYYLVVYTGVYSLYVHYPPQKASPRTYVRVLPVYTGIYYQESSNRRIRNNSEKQQLGNVDENSYKLKIGVEYLAKIRKTVI